MSATGDADGLPGYEAEPPGPEYTIPLPPPVTTPAPSIFSGGQWLIGIFPLVFGIVGALVFNLFGVVAIFIGIGFFRSAGVLGRILCGIGILAGLVGLVLSIIEFARTGDWFWLIF